VTIDAVTVVCWKWSSDVPTKGRPGDLLGERYTADHVNRLRAMVARHLPMPHRFVCVTDDARGLGPGVQVLRMPEGSETHWRCCRRLRMFGKEWRDVFGARALHLDLDTVIVGDLTELATLPDEVACWWAPQYSSVRPKAKHHFAFNPSVLLFDPPGPLRDVWDWYAADPDAALERAEKHGWTKWNSDMAILSDYVETHKIDVDVLRLGPADGIYGLRDDVMPSGSDDLPPNARIISFCDPKYDPAMPELQERYPWIGEAWRE